MVRYQFQDHFLTGYRDNGASSSENLNSHDNLSSGSCLTGDLPVNTAEKLQQAISCSSVPMDPLTRENLGFSKVDTYEDEVRLLSLYKGLLYLLPRPPTLKTVQQGPLNNQIAGGIYHIYESQGGESGYFSWFKKDQQVMDRDYANPNGPRAAPCSRSTMLDYAVWESGLGRHGLSELLLCLSEPCTKTCSPRIEGVRWCPKERISMNGREWNIQRYLQHRFTHMTPVTSSNINLPSSIRVT